MNTKAINHLRDGAAAMASIPDLYLGTDETWSIAGGLALYDDGYGGAETGFGGGFQTRRSTYDNWSFGISGADRRIVSRTTNLDTAKLEHLANGGGLNPPQHPLYPLEKTF